MKIKRINPQHRRDFRADYECEHCGHIEEDRFGYDDAYFHQNVIPKMKCKKCGKTAENYRPLTTKYDRLSSEAAEFLTALLEYPSMADALKTQLAALSPLEKSIILDRLLERARQEREWGAPPILEACLVVTRVDSSQGARLEAFLGELPEGQIRPSIIPKIGNEPWADTLFTKWLNGSVSEPVKTAIKLEREDGNITK